VVTFNNSNVLGSVNVANVPTTFQNGWLNMGFPLAGALTDSPLATVHELINTTNTIVAGLGGSSSSSTTVTYIGLPVVGFAVQTFSNGTLSVGGVNVLSNYGGNFNHKYQTIIQ
jgi:flagellin-like hook-associated protein FlgL